MPGPRGTKGYGGQRGRANGHGEGKGRDSPTDSPRTAAQAVGQGSRDGAASARTKGTREGGRDQVEMAKGGRDKGQGGEWLPRAKRYLVPRAKGRA